MSDTVSVRVCVLWEDEIRTAARAVRALNDLPADADEMTEHKAIVAVLMAATAALTGVSDDAALVISNRVAFMPKRRAQKRKAHVRAESGIDERADPTSAVT